RPIEGMRAAIGLSSLGLELSLSKRSGSAIDALAALRHHSVDLLFREAYRRVTEDVIFPAADLARRWLLAEAARSASEGDTARELAATARRVEMAMTKKTPWQAITTVEMCAPLLEDEARMILRTLCGLIDECPTWRRGSDGTGRFISKEPELLTIV